MPELPEVEAVCRIVGRALSRRSIASAAIARRRICAPQAPAQVVRAVVGRRFLGVERRGKNILIHLDGTTLWVHLRMTGNLYPIARGSSVPPSASAHFVLDNGRTLIFDDTRGLGTLRALKPAQLPAALGRIGLDPLSSELSPPRFVALARGARGSIKTWLMDQSRLAGLGNIYAAEALFRAGIDPRRPAAGLRRARLNRLHGAIVALLADAVKSATLAYRRPGRFAEAESFDPAVYGREGLPCRRCRRPIRRIQQSGRSTYFCPGCQT